MHAVEILAFATVVSIMLAANQQLHFVQEWSHGRVFHQLLEKSYRGKSAAGEKAMEILPQSHTCIVVLSLLVIGGFLGVYTCQYARGLGIV